MYNRLTLIACSVCLTWSLALQCAVVAAAEPTAVASFNLPAQPLADSLRAVATETQTSVLFNAGAMVGRQAPALNARLTVDEALARLLEGSGLTLKRLDDRTIVLAPAGASTSNSSEQATARGPVLRLAQTGETTPESYRADTDNSIQEVVVTAQKRSERLQEVPVPVYAISGESLTDSNQLRVQDYYNKVPGLSLALSGNGGQPVVTIRGITTGGNTNPTVGIIVDEVSYGSSANTGAQTAAVADIDPGDLARIEVLRGPQGTLYGAASMGGLLKFVTVDPSTEKLSGRIQVGSTSVSEGDDYGHSIRGSVNVPLGETFAVRVSGFTLRDPGYIDNAETGAADSNYRSSKGARLAALWEPSEAFSLKLGALIQDSARRGTEDVDVTLGENPQQRFVTGSGQYDRKTQAYSATMVAKIGQTQLISATGYSIDKLADNLDTTTLANNLFVPEAQQYFGVDRSVTLVHNTVKKFTQEVRASLPIGARTTWLLGAFYTEENTFRDNDTQAASSSGVLAGSLFKNLYDPSEFREYAAFTNLTFNFTDRFDVQVGGRYSDNKQNYPFVLSGPLVEEWFLVPSPLVTPPIKSQDSAVTYLLTPRFKISEDLMVYLRAASGYRPGGPNAACGRPGVPCKFGADNSRNYDIGVKGDLLGGTLFFDAAIYHIDWKDIQISNLSAPDGSLYTGNVSAASSQGVELSLQSRPLEGLTLSGWAAYNVAKLTEDFPAGSLLGRDGDRLPFSSRLSGNLSADQEFPLWNSALGFIGGTLIYVGDRTGNFQATTTRQRYPSYTQIDLRTGVKYDSWTMNLFVNNLTDKRGVLRGGLDAEFIPAYFSYIQPRTLGVSLTKTF